MAVVPVGPWPEGINLVDPVGALSPKALSYCENFRLDVLGNPYKRPGFQGYGSAPAKVNGDNFVNFLFRFYRETNNSKVLIAASNGKLKIGNDVTGAWTEITTPAAMHVSNLMQAAVYKDRLYIADGSQPIRYNGNATPVAVKAGHYVLAAPVFDSEAAGGLLGVGKTYKYMMTSLQGDLGQGPAGAVCTHLLTAANNEINLKTLEIIPAENEPSGRRVWRTKGDGDLFYFLKDIDNTVTTLNDKAADATLVDEYIPCHAPSTDCRFVLIGPDDRAYWFGRGGANASIVEVSEVGWPDRILQDDFFPINNNGGDAITAGVRVPGGILFFKRNSTWLIRQYGSSPINLSYYYGCTAPWSIQITPDGCMFLSQQGKICIYDGSIREVARVVRPEFKNMSEAAMLRVTSAYHEDIYRIAYDYRGQKGYNHKILEYDLIGNKWMGPQSNPRALSPSYYCVFDSLKDKGELYFGEGKAAAGSYVYQENSELSADNGTRYPAVLRTGQNSLEGLEDKEIIRAIVRGIFSGDSELNINIIKEDGTVSRATPIKLNTMFQSVYGTALYGTGIYGGLRTAFGEDSFDISSRTHLPIVELTDNGNATVFKVDTVNLIVEAMDLV